MSFQVPSDLEQEINDLIPRYPQKRSASLMILHALQDRLGYISQDAVEWVAARIEVQPINVYELVTFYPMFRQAPAGRYQIKVCRTLSCALAGSESLHARYCKTLGLDPAKHGLQTTPDGRFSVEFVECLASCHTAPVLMLNETLHENLTPETADDLLKKCP